MSSSVPSHPAKLVLASASPRRLDLLGQLGVRPDDVIPADIDETPGRQERPAAYARRMAFEKAAHVAGILAETGASEFVLSGDTVVALGRRILPKAETDAEARLCLALLSGRSHRVYGGITLLGPNGVRRDRLVQTKVRFRRLSSADMDRYIASGEWRGKAGGYAVQGLAAEFIRHIAGSYSNIVGFSLYDVAAMLRGNGVLV